VLSIRKLPPLFTALAALPQVKHDMAAMGGQIAALFSSFGA